MSNYVTQAELDQARETYAVLSEDDLTLLEEGMAEAHYERRAAFGGSGQLATAFVTGTGEAITPVLYELCYKARIAKLFKERDLLHKTLEENC